MIMRNSAARSAKPPLYLTLARAMEDQIREGVFRLGSPVPSVRELSRQRRVSISTVLQAYMWLEEQGWIEARPKSGYYVRTPYRELIPEPSASDSASRPAQINTGNLFQEIMAAASDPVKVPFGAACPSPSLMPSHKIASLIREIARRHPEKLAEYEMPEGSLHLRQQIARRSITAGCHFLPQEIVVTIGTVEALHLALRAVVKPGGIVAVSSPTYFGILQTIDPLGMKAIEIPTHPRSGMDLNVLEDNIRKHRIQAVITMNNGHNPLGYILADEDKKNMVDLLARHGVPLIEDDVYGDLSHRDTRPSSAKSFDKQGLVLQCSSFSKTLGPGLRVGWIQAGRFRDAVHRLKTLTNLSSPGLPQHAVAAYLESANYDRHLRQLRRALCIQVQQTSQAITKYFPEGTRLSRPEAGHVLWVELPKGIDSIELHRAAFAQQISVLPGPIFSPSGRFRNFLRINCGTVWSSRIDHALLTLGKLCEQLQRSTRN
jgi:DNA-binding transcriptional MocR family regulator